MNEATPPPDWDAIFHRARRQIVGRIVVVGAVGALGAVFLLGGGLSAQGSVSWRVLGHESEAKPETTPKKKHKPHAGKGSKHKQHEKQHNGNPGGGHHHKHKPPPPHKHHHQWNPCAGGDAATLQYCEPENNNTDGEPTVTTKAEE